MKKIIFLIALVAMTITAEAKNLVLDNQLSCDIKVTMYARNMNCTGYACYQYSFTVLVPAMTTINYTGPNDAAITWAPTPCNSPSTLFFTDFIGTNLTCGWTFDLGPCSGNTINSTTCANCGGAVNATLSGNATTITLTMS